MFLDLLKRQSIGTASLSEGSLAKLESAEKDMQKGLIAGVFVTAMTLIVVLFSAYVGKSFLGVNVTAILDAILFGILTYGLYIRNRFSAWAMLSLFVIEKIFQITTSKLVLTNVSLVTSVIFAILLLVGFCLGIKGAMAWHRILAKDKTHEKNGIESKQTWTIVGSLLAVVVIGSLAIYAQNMKKSGGSDQATGQDRSALSDKTGGFSFGQAQGYAYVSDENGFRAVFPGEPSRDEKTSDLGEMGKVKTITYSRENDGSNYLVFIYAYSDERLSESNPNFSVTGAMENVINGMANQGGAKLLNSDKTTIGGRDAYRYEIQINDERMDGLVVFRANRMYNVAVNYLSKDGIPADAGSYFDSFALID